jgi:hypothetical protein
MRLYEFTDPTKYLLPEPKAADFVKQSKNITTADAPEMPDRHSRKRLEIKHVGAP